MYEAEHLLLKRSCAVKVIQPEHCADDRALERFRARGAADCAIDASAYDRDL